MEGIVQGKLIKIKPDGAFKNQIVWKFCTMLRLQGVAPSLYPA